MRGSPAATRIRACGSVSAGVLFKPNPQPKQKVEGEKHVNHVSVPGWPGTVFILIHADLTFPILEALFDRPAQGRRFAELGKRRLGRSIREGVFDLTIFRAPEKQPDGRFLRHSVPRGIGSEAGHISPDWSFRPFRQDHAGPGALCRSGDLADRRRRALRDVACAGPTPSAGRGHQPHDGLFEKDMGVGPDAGKIGRV